MSNGMNTEQAKAYAETMSYSEAVSNVKYGKGIKYRKATMIKLRELAKIADMLDCKNKFDINECAICEYGMNCEIASNNCQGCCKNKLQVTYYPQVDGITPSVM